ncbi:hypothetical protein Tco_0882161 [Tanacetum coccineum]
MEKELLTKTFNVFKNESKEKEAKNIDTKIALEKKVKELDNMVCKMDFGKRFVPQRELSDEQALHPSTDQSASSFVKIEAPHELPKKGNGGLNTLKFLPMEAVFTTNFVDKQCFEIQKKLFLIENDRLLDQIISQDNVNIFVNSSLDINTSMNVNSSVAMNDSVNYVEMSTVSQLNCMFDARHELCFLEFVSDMNASFKSKSIKKAKKKEEWKSIGKVITATNKVPLREPIPLEVVTQEYVATKVYTRRPKVPKTNGSNSKPKIAKYVISNNTKLDTSRGSNTSVGPSSSSSVDLRLSKLFCGIWTPDAQST